MPINFLNFLGLITSDKFLGKEKLFLGLLKFFDLLIIHVKIQYKIFFEKKLFIIGNLISML